jgi:hypothetical protein
MTRMKGYKIHIPEQDVIVRATNKWTATMRGKQMARSEWAEEIKEDIDV